MYGLYIDNIDLDNQRDKDEVEKFLNEFDLILDYDVEYTVVAKLQGDIVGTCSFSGKVLKCFAVDEKMQGEGIAAKLITYATDVLFNKGIYETFIFTKSKNKSIFTGLGYKEVFETEGVILLEGGTANVRKYVDNMYKKSGLSEAKKAALVMNCNPFTLGHKYLIEQAAAENEQVVIFIVEENRSLFPFEIRLKLAREGVKDLKNVTVIPGGNYIISSSTFPSYFLKKEDERLKAYAKLDAGIFGKYIAPAFNINKRYVGTEPYCKVTNQYNNALVEVLTSSFIKIINRLELGDKAISASEVRELIKTDSFDKIKKLVPEPTYNFLLSDEAKEIIEKIKRSDSRH